MGRLLLGLFALFFFAGDALALVRPVNPKRIASELATAAERGQMAEKVDTSLDVMIRLAVFQLRAQGRDELADEIEDQWDTSFKGFLPAEVAKEDLGDHAPLSEWLALVYELLRLAVGDQVLAWTHLDDLYVINYAIPVVFNPKNPEWDMVEYGLHFVPLAGVTAYWTSYAACVGLTWGGGFFVICTPVSMAAEWIMTEYVAPDLSDWVYRKANDLPQPRRPRPWRE